MKTQPTFMGSVRRVVGAKVYVEISNEISVSLIIHGRVYRLGQVGSFVRIPRCFALLTEESLLLPPLFDGFSVAKVENVVAVRKTTSNTI